MCGSAPPAPKVAPLPPAPVPKASPAAEQVKIAKRQQGLMTAVNTGTSTLLGTG